MSKKSFVVMVFAAVITVGITSAPVHGVSNTVHRISDHHLNLPRLSERNIKRQQEIILREFKRKNSMRMGAVGASVALIAVCALLSYRRKSRDTSHAEYHQRKHASVLNAQEGSMASLMEMQLDELREINKSTDWLRPAEGVEWYKEFFFKSEDFKGSLRLGLMVTAIQMLAPKVLTWLGFDVEARSQGVQDEFDSLPSFIEKKLQISQLSVTLQYYGQELIKEDLSDYKRTYYANGLITACEHLNEQLELLLGYMRYRTPSNSRGRKISILKEAQSIITHIQATTNEFYCQAENIINATDDNEQQSTGKLQELITDFCTSLEQEIGHFSFLEHGLK